MITGLVLEGGGMRGMFTAGVLDALMGRHIEIDKIIGVSAGALFGINYASNQKERALRYNRVRSRGVHPEQGRRWSSHAVLLELPSAVLLPYDGRDGFGDAAGRHRDGDAG